MKISKKPTNYILIKAQTASEWDSCNAAILEIGRGTKATLRKYFNAVKTLGEFQDFYNASFWFGVDYVNIDEPSKEIEKAFENKGWCYVSFTEGEYEEIIDGKLDSISLPEQKIDAQMVKIHAEGGFNFSGSGKHTAEEFWTDSINIDSL
jgi:hypothetical protein